MLNNDSRFRRINSLLAKYPVLLGAVAVVALIIWLAGRIYLASVYPSPNHDEMLFGAMAANLLRHGTFGLDIVPDHFGLSKNMVYYGRLFPLFIAGVFKIFGMGLVQARLPVILSTLISAIMLGLCVRQLYSTTAGWLAAGLYLLSWNVFFYSALVRPEQMQVAGGLGVLYWVLRTREAAGPITQMGWGFLSAALLDVHLSYLHWFIALDLLILVYQYRQGRLKEFVWVVAGHGLGGLYWLAVHFLPDIAVSLDQWQRFQSPTLPRQTFAPALLIARIQTMTQNFSASFLGFTRLSPFEFGVSCVAAVLAIANWRKNIDLFLLTISLLFTLFVLLPNIHFYYLCMLFPAVTALQAAAFDNLRRFANRAATLQKLQRGWLAVLGLLFLGYIGGDLALAYANRTLDFDGAGQLLREKIPAEANLMGDSIWFYTFPEARFSDVEVWRFFTQLHPEMSIPETLDYYLRERKISYIVMSVDHPTIQQNRKYVDYVQQRCRQVDIITANLYGIDTGAASPTTQIKIFKCEQEPS